MSQFALILLPIITGLASVYWFKLVNASWALAPLSNILGYSLALIAALYIRRETPATLTGLLKNSDIIASFAIQAVLTVFVSLSWMIALKDAPLPAVAFVEISYPLFVLLFSALLIGNVHFQPLHWIGCACIVLGTSAIVIANMQAKANIIH